MFAGNPELLFGQNLSPFIVCFDDLFHSHCLFTDLILM
jgi:hypothetical protein